MKILKQNGLDAPSMILVQHNLSMRSLRFAMELGGLACPSMALTRADSPVLDFGEVSLIGAEDLVLPERGSLIFNGDGFVKRSPESWGVVDGKVGLQWLSKGKALLSSLGLEAWSNGDESIFYRKERLINPRSRVESVLRQSLGLTFDFLRQRGISLPLIKVESSYQRQLITSRMQDLSVDLGFQPGDHSVVNKAIHDEILVASLTAYLDREINAGESSPVLSTEELKGCAQDTIKSEIKKGLSPDQYDKGASVRALTDLFMANPGLSKEYDLFIIDLAAQMVPRLFFVKGSKVIALTCDSLVASLKKSEKGSEDCASVSVGRLKAATLSQINSTSVLLKKVGDLASTAEIRDQEQQIESLTRRFSKLMIESGLGSKQRGDIYSPLKVIEDAILQRADLSEQEIEKRLAQYGVAVDDKFSTVGGEILGLFREICKKVVQAKVPYFEAKIQRAVQFNEFTGAVFPSSLPGELKDFLRTQVLNCKEYEPGNHSQRAELLQSFGFNSAGLASFVSQKTRSKPALSIRQSFPS